MQDGARESGLRELFAERFHEEAAEVTPLKGDGSARTLYRLAGPATRAIGVWNPDPRENRAFLEFSRHFRGAGLAVPEVYAEDADRGIYLEEDLGDTTLFQFLCDTRKDGLPGDEATALYRRAIETLPRFQIEAGRTLDYEACYPRAAFDRQSMMWDLNYFKYYFLRLARVPFHEEALERDFRAFCDFLLQAPRRYFLYRDFQSRNIMVRGGELCFIDYQGGRRGALPYDVASLLFDARADLPFELRAELLERYLEAARRLERFDAEAFRRWYPGFIYIRLMQAMGAYGLRGFYERKQHFLASIPFAVQNLEYLLRSHDLPVELPELTQVWRRIAGSSRLRQFGTASLRLTVRIQSFSYQQGVPTDEKGHGGGFVFDCRGLPNPGRLAEFARLTGRDRQVVAFLEAEPAVHEFLGHIFPMIESTVRNYRSRNFTDLVVAFGCTGGRHRSVYCAERLAEHLTRALGVSVELSHLAADSWPA